MSRSSFSYEPREGEGSRIRGTATTLRLSRSHGPPLAEPKIAPDRPKIPKTAPRPPQDRPKTAPRPPKTIPRRPQTAPRSLKIAILFKNVNFH